MTLCGGGASVAVALVFIDWIILCQSKWFLIIHGNWLTICYARFFFLRNFVSVSFCRTIHYRVVQFQAKPNMHTPPRFHYHDPLMRWRIFIPIIFFQSNLISPLIEIIKLLSSFIHKCIIIFVSVGDFTELSLHLCACANVVVVATAVVKLLSVHLPVCCTVILRLESHQIHLNSFGTNLFFTLNLF